MAVYFIQAPTGHIKIGLAENPKRRLASLQTAWPSSLHLLRTEPGGSKEERDYHLRFAELRVGGEWFKCEGELAEFLEIKRHRSAAAKPKVKIERCANCDKRQRVVGRFCGPCTIHAAMSDPDHMEPRIRSLDELSARFDRYNKIAAMVGIEEARV